MAITSPGWYDDGHGALRWWDGTQWTEHVQTPDDEPQEAADALIGASTAAGSADAASLPSGPVSAPEQASPYVPELDSGFAPAAPEGYPGGFPGGDHPSGGFISATEPHKSRLWILWVVIGVVLLGAVIVASVLIPVALGAFGGGAANGGAAAVATVERYDDAWKTGDCDTFVGATTPRFREELSLAECPAFTAASEGFIASVEDYTITVTSIDVADDRITVVTSETFTSMVNEDGTASDVPVAFEDHYEYVVIPSDGEWLIDEALDADQQ